MSLPKPKIEMFDGVHANYDAKAWRFIKQYAGGGCLILECGGVNKYA